MNLQTSISCRHRPLHSFETSEVAIEAQDRCTLLDRQRGEMRVGRQVAGGTCGLEQSPKDFSMPLARMDHLRPGMVEPMLDDAEGVFYRERHWEDAAARAETQESK